MPHAFFFLSRRGWQRQLQLAAVLMLSGLGAQAPAAESAMAASVAEPVRLQFSDIFRQPIGPRGLEFTPALQEAAGRVVEIHGYMAEQEAPQAGRFWLAPRPVHLSEHADGEADDLPANAITVLLDESQRERLVPHHGGLLSLTGRLALGRAEDVSGRVSWLRLQLSPAALADGAASPPDSSAASRP